MKNVECYHFALLCVWTFLVLYQLNCMLSKHTFEQCYSTTSPFIAVQFQGHGQWLLLKHIPFWLKLSLEIRKSQFNLWKWLLFCKQEDLISIKSWLTIAYTWLSYEIISLGFFSFKFNSSIMFYKSNECQSTSVN